LTLLAIYICTVIFCTTALILATKQVDKRVTVGTFVNCLFWGVFPVFNILVTAIVGLLMISLTNFWEELSERIYLLAKKELF
jgi:hypothetical protein